MGSNPTTALAMKRFQIVLPFLVAASVQAPLRAADMPEPNRTERMVNAFRVLLPAVTELAGYHFRRVLLQVAQEHFESVGEPAP